MILFYEDEQGLSCRPSELIASITPAHPDRFRVVTSEGEVGYCYEVADLTRGDLCQVSKDQWLSPRQMRRVDYKDECLWITLDSGETVRVTRKWVPDVRSYLGLDRYKPQPQALTRLFLREYPFELVWAPTDVLKQLFPNARLLIANVIWQTLHYIREGQNKGYGHTHHGFFYKPLDTLLHRAGFINETFTKDAAEELYQRILTRMVNEDRLFDYRDLGFRDVFPNQRELGARRPDIILIIEKECLSEAGIAAARHCGISWIITGGVARVVSVEFFCAALHQLYQGPVTAIDYGDFDPGGWLNGRVFVRHLERFNTPCPNGVYYLVRPELFTEEELEILGRPISSKDGRADDWLAESGGIHGQPRGIHADWLHPPERVQRALEDLLQQIGVQP